MQVKEGGSMREDLLQFIWRKCYFNQSHLFTEEGEAVQVVSPGQWNTGQGPDFHNARIRIGGFLYEGSVELHVAASDWNRHGHQGDIHYQDVILHVVWEDDGGPRDFPTLVLQPYVSKLLLEQYEKWMSCQLFVPCAAQLGRVEEPVWIRWKEQLLYQRLLRRTQQIRGWLDANQQHWEEVTWWLMARSMGMPVNGPVFEAIARSCSFRLLARYRDEPHLNKALLLGQAGLLEDPALQDEYRFLRLRHRLKPVQQSLLFKGIRPAHAPVLRLAQLAELFSTGEGWFARIKEAASPADLNAGLLVQGVGEEMRRGLVVNAFIPLLFAYGELREERAYQEKALRWLLEEKPEKNAIITQWQRLGVSMKTAADSQSLLELKKSYCGARKCLDCAIGQALLGRTGTVASRPLGA
ncbi:MAG: DUF2851 family protein [Bacteroidetes bacterium]|nr:DUF2851 family protein [Bacteroidota bacterium]